MPAKITLDELSQFTGTANWYRHNLVPFVLYTDGVKYLADTAGAHWLIDKIATLQIVTLQIVTKIRAESFQAWELRVADGSAALSCEDGNGHVVHRERIDYTDFPLERIALWVEFDGTNRVIMLPSEH